MLGMVAAIVLGMIVPGVGGVIVLFRRLRLRAGLVGRVMLMGGMIVSGMVMRLRVRRAVHCAAERDIERRKDELFHADSSTRTSRNMPVSM